jgi:class 3 adenylate cyclase
MRTANLAIVFTDIKGFTARTSHQTYEQNQRMLRVHDALLMPVFRSFSGRPIKTIGDAFLVVFESPTQAVLCGVAIQDRLWDYNRRVPESEQIHVRVAVNMGEVRVERGDVFGEPVNIAARVEGIADAGEVLFTEAVHLSMNKAEVPSEERGLFELKGIPEKVRVYRVPKGGYRLSAAGTSAPAAAEGIAAEAPPYGGLALGRLHDLPAPDPATLESSGELLGHIGSLASVAALGARRAGSRLRERASAAYARLQKLPLPVRLGAPAALVALLAAVALLSSGFGKHPIERAIAAGDLELARRELAKLEQGPQKLYFDGLYREARKDWDGAARRFEQAFKGGEKRGLQRLIELTESETCQARAQAARALGRAGDRRAVGALEELESASFRDESGEGGVFALFGCNSRKAAREALDQLGAKKD